MIDKFYTKELVEQLVEEYGSPIYLYDEQTIQKNINNLHNLIKE